MKWTRRVSPVEGYDRWAATYDAQAENVVFVLEAALFTELVSRIEIEGKTLVDVGCGTGRHWKEILSRYPARLIGVDPSHGMLERLKASHPDAHLLSSPGDRIAGIEDASCDVILSTLALAHIPSVAHAMREWSRILRAGGAILLTDFHPDAIQAGMKRTFTSGGETLEIEHHSTSLERLQEIALDERLTPLFVDERVIDESVRPFFERAQYLEAYDRNKNVALVFGMHLLKTP
ncbi:MAG TPA: class I SAM-dependent methyltransferase [Terriglobia bacterium]|jgi:ubiquinone/menaquinone biosynthesis C-methylase UbiE